MSTRGLYQLDDGTFVRTQSEVPKGQTPRKVEVPIGSQELCNYLNCIILDERAQTETTEGTPSQQVEEEVSVPSPPPPPATTHAEQLLAFEDQWDEFPLARKLHFASLATEEAREKLNPAKYQPV